MAKRYLEADVNNDVLNGLRVAILGYGSQGCGQALNLRDSGIDVILGLRPGGKSWHRAVSEGWQPFPIDEACRQADAIGFLTPDMSHGQIFSEHVQSNLKPNATLFFAHGFSVHFKIIEIPSDVNVIMVAPKGSGATVRNLYLDGGGVAALIAVHQDVTGTAHDLALGLGWGIGAGRTGMMDTTFAEESETDLFSEQAILCGGLPELILAGWETLVEAGYQPEIAYFECLHEVKLIADLLYEGGLKKMYEIISETAAFGGITNGKRVLSKDSRASMRKILAEIRDGSFAKQWQDVSSRGDLEWRTLVKEHTTHPIETVGQEMRRQFLWKRQ
jgi:ketol-acid reductoisomerase